MKIYTKFGDRGQTVLFDGRRVGKDHLRIETYGTIDELNSHLGLAAAGCGEVGKGRLREMLAGLQGELFELGADLATPREVDAAVGKVRRMGAEDVKRLEGMIDAVSEELSPLKRFILPGGTETAARLHVARTVCRRAERQLVKLMGQEDVGEQALIYVNRLGDLLFVMARWANKLEGVGDVEWVAGGE